MLKHRARKEEDKQARRDAILDVAATMLGRREFASITMAEVARRCGLAKGTLYLYFGSKEELFLATLERELAAWFDALGEQLARRGNVDANAFGRLVARSLRERDTLTDLLTLLHAVLERNVDPEAALAFKRVLKDKLVHGGAVLQRVMPRLPPGGGVRLLVRIHALVVGLRQMADPPPNIAEVLRRDELAVLRIDFESELAAAIASLIRGMAHEPANTP